MLNIKQRQMNLKFLNYAVGNVDGIEGKNTKTAYKAFQRDFNLNVDGIYGEKTNAKLVEIIKEIQKEIETEIDGVAGEKTKQKCKEYQEKNKLKVDGICGIETRNCIYSKEITWDNIRHFKKKEFTCKCGCGLNNIDLNLVKILDEIREYFDSALIVTSACRCTKHNLAVGGVQGSRHKLGKAADFKVKGVEKAKLLSYCKELVQEGKARYTYTNETNMKNVVHLDIK